jgi:hypothetical protein
MSATERVHRFRAKHRKPGAQPSAQPDAARERDALAARVRELEVENARLSSAPDKDTKSALEIERLRQELAAATAARVPLDAENFSLRYQLAEARKEAAKPPKPVLDPDSELARERERRLAAERRYRGALKWANEVMDTGDMPQKTYNALVKVLHSDKEPPSVEKRTEAFALLTQWKQERDKKRIVARPKF